VVTAEGADCMEMSVHSSGLEDSLEASGSSEFT
jgi:hypothetical protein